MPLSIKNARTCRLIRELADQSGETIMQAVEKAVREKLERLPHQSQPRLKDRLLRIGKECAENLSEPARSIDHGDLLYGHDATNRLGSEIAATFERAGLQSNALLRRKKLKPTKPK